MLPVIRNGVAGILNLAGANVFQHLPGAAAVNDPFYYTLLWRTGALPPTNIIHEVTTHQFGLIVFWNDTVVHAEDESDPVGRVFASVSRSYRLVGKGARLQYWGPRAGSESVSQ